MPTVRDNPQSAGMRKERIGRGVGEQEPWEDWEGGFDGWLYEAMANPWNYGEMVLGVDIYPKQKEILEAALRYPWIAIAGCNSSGKTFSMTPFSLWKLTMAERVAILQIAPTRDQSKGVFWRDMRGLYRTSPMARELLGNAEILQTQLEVSDYRYAMAVSPGDVMSLRGYHAEEMMFILDEGNGVNAEFFTAIDGIAASGDISVMQLGNPTQSSGIFYDAFMESNLGWHTMNISSFDSPNLLSLEVPEWFDEVSEAPGSIKTEDRRKLAYLVYLRKKWIEKRDRMPGKDIPELQELMADTTVHLTRRAFVADGEARWAKNSHPSWYGQVLGVFPPESEYQLINRDWIEKSATPVQDDGQSGFYSWGVDPSGMGTAEFSLVGVWIDNESLAHRMTVCEGLQGTDALDRAMQIMQPYMTRTMWINVDRMGAGERPAIELKRWAEEYGVPVYAFVSQQQSTNPTVFRDIKSQAYYYLRDMMEYGLMSGLIDRTMNRQLLSLQYEMTNRGQVAMESKQNMRKRGVVSPDRADALAYACFPLAEFCPWQIILGS